MALRTLILLRYHHHHPSTELFLLQNWDSVPLKQKLFLLAASQPWETTILLFVSIRPPGVKNWLTGKDPDARKDWKQEERGTTVDEMIEWHHGLDGHEFEQALGVGDGQGSLVRDSPWGRKESDTTEQLNWTELNLTSLGLHMGFHSGSAVKNPSLLWPHRRQPTRLLCSWDSPGKNTGVACHFLLQCMKVKSESEVCQLCLTLNNPMDYSLPGSSVHGILQAKVLEWGAIAFYVVPNSFRSHRL